MTVFELAIAYAGIAFMVIGAGTTVYLFGLGVAKLWRMCT